MIEIQVHPSDIRRKVRYLFLDRRVVAGMVGLAILLLGVVVGSMMAAPSVIRRVYKINHLRVMKKERAVQAVRLKNNVEQMTAVERELDRVRVRVEKLIAVYGLEGSALGQGGLAVPIPDGADLKDAQRRERHLRQSVAKLVDQLEMLAQYERANAEVVRHTPSILPLPADQFVLTSPFGTRVSPFTRTSDFHKGLDLAAQTGTPIYATGDGVVTFAGRYPISQSVAWWRFGNVVVINHADRFITIYGHCSTTSVQAGQRVRQGQVIATVGSTGWSTNSHLHYEVRSDLETAGKHSPIDPRIYILNYQWSNEETLLIKARASKDYRNFDPLPLAFVGKRRV